MMNYDNEIKLAKERKAIESSEIFDYRDTPNEILFNNFYNFCRGHLDNNIKKYNIEPSIFIFTSSQISNAKAKYYNDTFSIQINLGLFRFCSENFLRNSSLDKHIEEKYSRFLKFFDIPVSTLAFQIATQFTYFHEFAHLVQFSKRRDNASLQERHNATSNYDQAKHHLEINADMLASTAIASHIEYYIIKSFGDKITQENIEFTISLLCSCLLNYIANFCDDLTRIYFNEYEHPHPFIRLFIINLNIVNILNNSEFLKEKGIELPTNQVFEAVLKFYQELEKINIFKTELREAINEASKQQQKIIEFMGDLIEFDLDNYNDAMSLWNKYIT